MKFGETISNNHLDASHYYYNIKRVSLRRRVCNKPKETKKFFKEYKRK